jgi:hypothetical protein
VSRKREEGRGKKEEGRNLMVYGINNVLTVEGAISSLLIAEKHLCLSAFICG